jgi:hypothetical protein
VKPLKLLRIALLGSALATLAACDGPRSAEEAASEQDVRTKANRQRLGRFARVDGFARLYLGESLAPAELGKLANKSEAAVVEALVSRAEYKQRFALRVGAFLDRRAPEDPASAGPTGLDPAAPLADTLKTNEQADRFARWLTRELAPRIADDLVKEHGKSFAQMTYRELLDTIRNASADRGQP